MTDDALPPELARELESALAVLNRGDAADAARSLEQIVGAAPNCAKALCGWGTALRQLGRIEEAIRRYDAALALQSDYSRAHFNRGLAHFDAGRIELAFNDFERAIACGAEPGFFFHRAACLMQMERFAEALDDCERCLAADPECVAAHHQRGVCLYFLDRREEALVEFSTAIDNESEQGAHFNWRGIIAAELGNSEAALGDFDRAIALQPNTAHYYFRRGCQLYEARDLEAAIRDFDEAMRLDPALEGPRQWRGCAWRLLDEPAEAICDFTEIIVRGSANYRTYIERAEAHLALDQHDAALQDIAVAISLDATKSRPHVVAAAIHAAGDLIPAAMRELDLAVEKNPSNQRALRDRSRLRVLEGNLAGADADLAAVERLETKSSQEQGMTTRSLRISMLLAEHFQPLSLSDLEITERRFPYRMRVDLQRAADDLFGDQQDVVRFCGVQREHDYHGLAFADLLFPNPHNAPLAAPPQYEEVDIGEAEPARCLKNGLWLLARDDVKYAVLLTPALRHGEPAGMQFQVAIPREQASSAIAGQFFSHLEAAVARSASYRGKILSLEISDYYSGLSTGIRVHKLRSVARDQVVLPAKTLDLLDRNIVAFAQQREQLRGWGLSTKKGLLFYGPPGTGKTHTIHYLAGSMEGHTTLLISAEQVGLLGEYMTLARLLQPSMVVIEDADLIARDRGSMQSPCEEVLLNKLLNEMDGLRGDADVFFILTTNRPEALEAALAARPGRIDQAIEFPLPDAEGRATLIRLYSRALDVPNEVVDATVKRTEGVSASFIKELMRRAAQSLLTRGGGNGLAIHDVESALGELLFTGGALNCSLLGFQRDAETGSASDAESP